MWPHTMKLVRIALPTAATATLLIEPRDNLSCPRCEGPIESELPTNNWFNLKSSGQNLSQFPRSKKSQVLATDEEIGDIATLINKVLDLEQFDEDQEQYIFHWVGDFVAVNIVPVCDTYCIYRLFAKSLSKSQNFCHLRTCN